MNTSFPSSHSFAPQRPRPNFVPVWMKVAEVDAAWKRYGIGYIQDGGGSIVKRERLTERFAQRLPISATLVCLLPGTDGIKCKIIGGRHRYCVQRDAGAEWVRVSMDALSYGIAKTGGMAVSRGDPYQNPLATDDVTVTVKGR